MIIAIHQPNFIPWLGYFYKIAKADTFVILDDVQYTKNSFINRNKIKTPNGSMWLTVPVITSEKFGQKINEVEIKDPIKTSNKILNTVKANYSRSEYFKLFFPEFESIINKYHISLSILNSELIQWVCKILDINTRILYSSKLPANHNEGTFRLVDICKLTGATIYLSGFGGNKYQDENIFRENKISLNISDFNHPVYKQLWGNFESNLSVIDLIFNSGPKSRSILLNSRAY
jgi:hypothetical protein